MQKERNAWCGLHRSSPVIDSCAQRRWRYPNQDSDAIERAAARSAVVGLLNEGRRVGPEAVVIADGPLYWELTLGLNLDQKKAVVAEVSAQVAGAQAIVVAEYRGLEVGDITGLRARARKEGVYLRVLKNTLARRAVAGTPFEGLAGHMAGPLIYGISKDPVAAAKALNEFAKSNDKLVIKAGAMANYVMDAAGVKALATMPSRDELLATLLGTLQAPVAKFVRTLNEVPSKFVRALAAVRDQKEAA